MEEEITDLSQLNLINDDDSKLNPQNSKEMSDPTELKSTDDLKLNQQNSEELSDLTELNSTDDDDLKLQLQNLDKLLNTLKSIFNVSEVVKSQIKDLKERILYFEKLDYEVDKGLMDFVSDSRRQMYLDKLNVVKDILVQIERYEKQLESDELIEFSD